MSYIAKRHENKWIIPKTTCAYCKTEKKKKKKYLWIQRREIEKKWNENELKYYDAIKSIQRFFFFCYIISLSGYCKLH